MIYNGKEVEFPAVMQISFFKAIEALENMAKDADKGEMCIRDRILT